MGLKERQITAMIYWTIGLLIFSYVVLRAYFIAPYQDELTTFFRYVLNGHLNPFTAALDANNHYINTLLTRWSFLLFGDNAFLFLRLPNVFAFLLLLFYLYKIAGFFASRHIGFLFGSALIFSIYLISYFSLSRGYGLSYAFMMGSIFYLFSLSTKYSSRDLALGCIMASLAVWSNHSMVLTLMIIVALYAVWIVKYGKLKWQALSILALFAFLPFLSAVVHVHYLRKSGSLYFGIEDGFVNFALRPLIEKIYPGPVFWYFFLMMTLIPIGVFLWRAAKRGAFSKGLSVGLILLGTFAGIYISHIILDVNYPIGRVLFHVYFLIVLVFYLFLDSMKHYSAIFLALILPVIFAIQLVLSFNLSYTPLWSETSLEPSFLQSIMSEHKENRLPLVHSDHFLGISYNHFNYTGEENYNVAQTGRTSNVADFLILNDWCDEPDRMTYSLLDSNEATGVKLFDRNKPIIWHPLAELEIGQHEIDEFLALFSVYVDTLVGKSIRLDLSGIIEREAPRTEFRIAVELRSYNEDRIEEYNFDLRRILSPDTTGALHKSIFIENISSESKYIHVFLWNVESQEARVKNFKLNLFWADQWAQ